MFINQQDIQSRNIQMELQNNHQQITLQTLQTITMQFQNKIQQLNQENQRLKNDNADLQSRVNVLENHSDELLNDNQDLRQLIKRVYEEGEIQIAHLKERNVVLQQQNKKITEEKESIIKSLVNVQDNIEMYAQLGQCSELLKDY